MKLLIHPAVDEERLAKIAAVGGESVRIVNAADADQALAEIPDADAFFGKITPPLLAAAGQLRWVQTFTASLEHYVFPELVDHPCTLSNMRGLFSDVIADHVFGYILCFARNLHLYLRQQADAIWAPIGGEDDRSDFASGPAFVSGMDRAHMHLSDCTLGVVGLGHIGMEVARRGRAFGMDVVAVDPKSDSAPPEVSQLWRPQQLDQLLAISDFVVICAPHTPATAGWFQTEQFRQMKPGGYLVNIGRGAIVRLEQLNQSLNEGHLAGAALDVFEQEPLPPDHPLWKQPNVLITPHVAACSVHIAERHLEVLLENLRRFIHNQPLQNIVSKTEWY